MIKTVILVGIFAIAPFAAGAATCEAGYYLSGGECVVCNQRGATDAHYCTGDEMRYPCPTTDTDYNQFGYIVIRGQEANWVSPLQADKPAQCISDLYFRDEYGNEFLHDGLFNGTNYWNNNHYWYYAAPGFYLSSYYFSTSEVWYRNVKPCTNAPVHSHYTGASTPDAPEGSVRDTNDCP